MRCHALLAALCLLPTAALACGPSRQKAVESIEINAPADKVWAAISNYQDMTWHPLIKKSDAPPTLELETTRRTLTAHSGGVIRDHLAKFDPETRTIAFMTDEADQAVLPVVGYTSTLIAHADGDKTRLEWRGAFSRGYLKADPPPELNDEAAMRAVTAFQHNGLMSLKARLERQGKGS